MHTQESGVSIVHAARNMLFAGDAATALAKLDSSDATGFATYHIVRAECLYAQHTYADAKKECEAALALSPNSPRVTILFELIQEMITLDQWVQPERPIIEKRTDDTQLEFPKMERLAPPEPSVSEGSEDETAGLVSETLATILAKQEKYSDARKIYIQLSRLHPDRDAYFHERIVEMERRMQGSLQT